MLYIYIYVYIYMYMYHLYLYTYIYIYIIHTYIYIYINIYMNTYVYILYVCRYTYMLYIYTYIYIYINTHIEVFTISYTLQLYSPFDVERLGSLSVLRSWLGARRPVEATFDPPLGLKMPALGRDVKNHLCKKATSYTAIQKGLAYFEM